MAGVWKRTMVYLGLMEDEEELEETHTDEAPPLRREDSTQMVRTIRREDAHPAGRGIVRSVPAQAPSPRQVHVVEPRIYEDAQEFADRFKSGVPVIINLRQTEARHAPKILHFASGLVYGLSGRMQRVADSVYLITPANVEVSADEKRALAERGFFGDF
jgi:cell division inhibitor SepF